MCFFSKTVMTCDITARTHGHVLFSETVMCDTMVRINGYAFVLKKPTMWFTVGPKIEIGGLYVHCDIIMLHWVKKFSAKFAERLFHSMQPIDAKWHNKYGSVLVLVMIWWHQVIITWSSVDKSLMEFSTHTNPHPQVMVLLSMVKCIWKQYSYNDCSVFHRLMS